MLPPDEFPLLRATLGYPATPQARAFVEKKTENIAGSGQTRWDVMSADLTIEFLVAMRKRINDRGSSKL
ncbi:hypothetical protein Aple_025480 [Acrocarpospora pleiomorpha]|uniref:Uncharacterized protein n=1 Tax=Acrocarpospora pleiomorpha TaxID=90975 RepID=A0A5M3XFZ0_9ACTN|nr:hypothetical protein Aple_025480 [Acrocarpospora pleiomorpha]